VSDREKIAEALREAYREGYADAWAYRSMHPREGTASDPWRETQSWNASRSCSLLTSQPEDVGEPTLVKAAGRALVLLDAYNGMTLPIGIGEEARGVADDLRAALTRHPTKEAENG
jgi:hypothetical protein